MGRNKLDTSTSRQYGSAVEKKTTDELMGDKGSAKKAVLGRCHRHRVREMKDAICTGPWEGPRPGEERGIMTELEENCHMLQLSGKRLCQMHQGSDSQQDKIWGQQECVWKFCEIPVCLDPWNLVTWLESHLQRYLWLCKKQTPRDIRRGRETPWGCGLWWFRERQRCGFDLTEMSRCMCMDSGGVSERSWGLSGQKWGETWIKKTPGFLSKQLDGNARTKGCYEGRWVGPH